MKKALKTIISAALAFMLAFGMMSAAFAAEETKTVTWDTGYNHTQTCFCAGEVGVGKNTIGAYDDENLIQYYEFDAEEAGYYALEFSYFDMFSICFPESFDGKTAKGYGEYEQFLTHPGSLTLISYLPEGETVLFANAYNDTELTIEYYGAEITSFEYDTSKLSNLILGEDLGGDYGFEGFSYIYFDGTLEFSSGKTIALDDNQLKCNHTAEPREGKNIVTYTFGNYSEDITVYAYPITKYVKSLEIENPENVKLKMGYDGMLINSFDYSGILATVTYTDGTKESFDLEEGVRVKIPEGREYYASISSYHAGGSDYVNVELSLAGEVFCEAKIETEKATLTENIEKLASDCERDFINGNFSIKHRLEDAFGNGSDYTAEEKFERLAGIPGTFAYMIQSIISNFRSFIGYYSAIV